MYARTASNPRRERVAHPLKKLTMRTALSHLSTVRLASLSKTVFLTKSLDRTRSRDTRSISDGKCPRISRSGCVRLKTESQNEHIGAMVGSQESQLSGTSDWGLRLFGTSASLPSLDWFGPSSNFQHRTRTSNQCRSDYSGLNRRHNLPVQPGPNAQLRHCLLSRSRQTTYKESLDNRYRCVIMCSLRQRGSSALLHPWRPVKRSF